MIHILRKLRDDVAGMKRYDPDYCDRSGNRSEMVEEPDVGDWLDRETTLALIDALIAALPEPSYLVKRLTDTTYEALGARFEAADLITSQKAENATLLAAKEAAEVHAEAGWDQQRHWSNRYIEKASELEAILTQHRAEKAAGFLAGRDAAAEYLNGRGRQTEAEIIASFEPPADDAAALEALIREGKADGWDEGFDAWHYGRANQPNPYRHKKGTHQ